MSQKRAREERKRMEGRYIYELKLDDEGMPIEEHYACTGFTIHHPECNQLTCEVLDPWDVLLNEEKREWNRAGIQTTNVNMDGFIMDAQIKTLITILQEELGVDKDKLDDVFRKTTFRMMREVRAMIVPQLQKQQLLEGIIGPNGQPLKP
jgi:hypothetical protein